MQPTRRQFLESAIGGGMALGGGLAFLSKLAPVSAADTKLDPSHLAMENGIGPVVKLLEDTPPEKLIEEVAAQVKNGLTYRELLAGLLVAAVRNVQPRPQVGFKFHAVLVINSAHLASLASPEGDRWLPIFWSLDRFKSAQIETQRTSGWKMGGVDESKVPPASRARATFTHAMDDWDEEAADAASAGLARSCGRDECFELFARYGARDWRDIGHKAIYVSNAFRTLDCIGWQHAEPVLRSLAYALLKYDGPNPSTSDQAADRPGRRNTELARKVRSDWLDGKHDPDAAAQMLETFRHASDEGASKAVVEALNHGLAADTVWDAILAASGELMMRRPGIISLHSVTTSNALRFAYGQCASPDLRLMLLLQSVAFVPLFRGNEAKADAPRVDEFEPAVPSASGSGAIAEIFAEASHDRMIACRKALAYLDDASDATGLLHAARRLVFLKGNDAHDYKFSSAVLEDYYHVSPRWRNRYLATSLFYLPGSEAKDNDLIHRIRAAFA